jgi:hypothetical protein
MTLDVRALERPRTYEVRTYGCQMNVHDSERLSGLLEEAGYWSALGDASSQPRPRNASPSLRYCVGEEG